MSSISDIVKRLRENRLMESNDYSDKSREELIQLAQDGDRRATDLLISNHKDFIKKMSSKYFLDTGDRDDVEQLATIAFWDAIMSWDGNGDFDAFAGMVIKRKMTDELRKDSAEKVKISTLANSIEDTIASDDEGGGTTIGDTLASKEASPEEQYLGKAGARELMEFMRDKFSPNEREVIRLYIKGYKVSEIAEELNMKYKSAENALMRVKNKLTDYLRTRESKKITESKSVEFSDEEKLVLESVLTKIDTQTRTVSKLRESYENYTEEQLDDELNDMDYEIGEITLYLEDTYYDDRDEMLDMLDGFDSKLYAMEDYLTSEQKKRAEEIRRHIRRAEDVEYKGVVQADPYSDRGLKPSDFHG